MALASVNTGQQLGGSIGTSLLNTMAASATAAYLTAHVSSRTLVGGKPSPSLTTLALVHGYVTAFWWAAGIFALGAVVAGVLFRRGPLSRQETQATSAAVAASAPQARAARG
ncbi:MAG TPA: hypothetical protein VMV92_23405 [Streptosporangiaceae bacterium]|nr:hypothetical protein [Streptosporangiaceae bacterium]